MSDQESPIPRHKTITHGELTQLAAMARMGPEYDIEQFHKILIHFWCTSINKLCGDIPDRKLSFNEGVTLMNFLYKAVLNTHLLASFPSKGKFCSSCWESPNQLCSNCAKVREPIKLVLKNLELSISPKPIVLDESKNNLLDPNEVEWSCELEKKGLFMLEWQRYPEDQRIVAMRLKLCWLYLYEQFMQRKRDAGHQKNSKGRDSDVKEALEADGQNAVKVLLNSGSCLGCGDKRDEQSDYRSPWYCSPECKKQFGQFFRDWKETKGRKKRKKGTPSEVTSNQILTIFREKKDKFCRDCKQLIDRQNKNAARCSECIEKSTERPIK